MKFIDLQTQHEQIRGQIQQRISEVLESNQFILGRHVGELEQRLAEFVGVKHCIAVANGTDALLAALMALDVKAGDEVIVPDFTFIAPAEMVLLLGAKPVFVDINPKTYNLEVEKLEDAISERTKAIIPVSLYGQCADFDTINAIANRYSIPVIEDAAQSFGAVYKGRTSCNLSTAACTSFFPSKPLGCYGDGGACFTNDDELAAKIRCISNHGQQGRYNHACLGLNSRLDTIQAAVLLAKLAIFPKEIKRRNEIAYQYSELLNGCVSIPYVKDYNSSVYAQYTIASPHRDKIQQFLQQKGIPTAIHYQCALHKQPVFAEVAKHGIFANSELAANSVLSLPFHPYLTVEQVAEVAEAVVASLD